MNLSNFLSDNCSFQIFVSFSFAFLFFILIYSVVLSCNFRWLDQIPSDGYVSCLNVFQCQMIVDNA